MATVLETTTARKPLKAYYAPPLRRRARHARRSWRASCSSFSDDGHVQPRLSPQIVIWLCVLGEVGLSEVQRCRRSLAGGAAAIACQRQMEVA